MARNAEDFRFFAAVAVVTGKGLTGIADCSGLARRPSIPISDDHEGKTATLVVLDEEDLALTLRTLTVGR